MDYKKLSVGLGFVVAFLAGCLARETFIVPPARAGTSPTRWEYECMEETENVAANADKYGAKGWELAAAAGAGWGSGIAAGHSMKWCFKRPLP